MLIQNVNVERKIVMTESHDNEKYPIILCIPGGGFTHCERNRILPEVQFLAEEGFLIASIDYRLSSTANCPMPSNIILMLIKLVYWDDQQADVYL